MTNKIKRREVTVKRNPGIFRIQVWDAKSSKWVDSKYRAIRRVEDANGYKKESAVFEHLEEAKRFRGGEEEFAIDRGHHKFSPVREDKRLKFGTLVESWKAFHFQMVDVITQQTYAKRLPFFKFLNDLAVDDINPSVIDQLVVQWKADPNINASRHSFDKELDTLKVILNFYRRRNDPRFPIPIYRDHYQAGKVKKFAKDGVKVLSADDLRGFFSGLRRQKNPIFFPLALTQFCLSLRIGEVCGLHWADVDFKNMTVRIQNTISWNYETWEATIKNRPKNGKIRTLSMPEVLKDELLRWKDLNGATDKLVFHKNGEPLNRQTVSKAYQRSLELSGITEVRGTHMVRRSSATHANRVTGDFFAVSLNLGHSNPEETTRYVSEMSEQKLKVANALNGIANEVLGNDLVPQRPTPGATRRFSLVKSKG
jgi:integrase